MPLFFLPLLYTQLVLAAASGFVPSPYASPAKQD